MKKIFFYILCSCLFSSSIFSQEPVIKNLNLYYKDKNVIVNYDLKDFKRSKELHTIELFFVDDNFNVVVPHKISGDFGDSIMAGQDKQIKWAVFDDNVNITRKLRPIVLADGLNKGGSANVIWSFFVPGLGDYFVENPRNMIFKPYLKTLLFFGCVTLGYMADQNRIPLVWKEWDRTLMREVGFSYADDHWLFAFDKEIFYFAAASIWIMDLIWVYSKGNQNERLKVFTKFTPTVSKSKNFTNLGININL